MKQNIALFAEIGQLEVPLVARRELQQGFAQRGKIGKKSREHWKREFEKKPCPHSAVGAVGVAVTLVVAVAVEPVVVDEACSVEAETEADAAGLGFARDTLVEAESDVAVEAVVGVGVDVIAAGAAVAAAVEDHTVAVVENHTVAVAVVVYHAGAGVAFVPLFATFLTLLSEQEGFESYDLYHTRSYHLHLCLYLHLHLHLRRCFLFRLYSFDFAETRCALSFHDTLFALSYGHACLFFLHHHSLVCLLLLHHHHLPSFRFEYHFLPYPYFSST